MLLLYIILSWVVTILINRSIFLYIQKLEGYMNPIGIFVRFLHIFGTFLLLIILFFIAFDKGEFTSFSDFFKYKPRI